MTDLPRWWRSRTDPVETPCGSWPWKPWANLRPKQWEEFRQSWFPMYQHYDCCPDDCVKEICKREGV